MFSNSLKMIKIEWNTLDLNYVDKNIILTFVHLLVFFELNNRVVVLATKKFKIDV